MILNGSWKEAAKHAPTAFVMLLAIGVFSYYGDKASARQHEDMQAVAVALQKVAEREERHEAAINRLIETVREILSATSMRR